jgi:Protein of unknown function (DUF2868)
MPERERWSLAELIDLEISLSDEVRTTEPSAFYSQDRSTAFKQWLEHEGKSGTGRLWLSALSLMGNVFAITLFISGIGAAWGCLDRGEEGIHVVLFLATTLGIPWLILLVGLLLWIFKPGHLSVLGQLLLQRIGKEKWEKVQDSLELLRALGWRCATLVQTAAAAFHAGALSGLLAMVFFKRVGFYWETTTEHAMRGFLEKLVHFLSLPWREIAPSLIPKVAETERNANWHGGGQAWWMFLVLALIFWGMLPRVILMCYASWRESRVMKTLSFQAPRHRRLWRLMQGSRRDEIEDRPADGALVIELGGSHARQDALRPLFLQRLRLNPKIWESTGVLDEDKEASARKALKDAPAGIILLAEAWSLAPRQMEGIFARLRNLSAQRRLILYVTNLDSQGQPTAPNAGERANWERFLDQQRGFEIELHFHEIG